MQEDVFQNDLFEIVSSLKFVVKFSKREREEIYELSGRWNAKIETNFTEVTGLYYNIFNIIWL